MISQAVAYMTVLVIFLYIFFGCLMFTNNKDKRKSKWLLGLFFIVFGGAIFDIYAQVAGIYLEHNYLAFFLNTLPLLFGPILWLLSKSVTQENVSFTKKDGIHFSPYILTFFLFILVYHIQNSDVKAEFIQKALVDQDTTTILPSFLLFFSIGVYIFYSMRLLNAYRNRIKNNVSDVSKINLEWLEHVLIGFIGIGGATVLIQTGYVLFSIDGKWISIALFGLLIYLFYYILKTFVKALKSEDIFSLENAHLSLVQNSLKSSSYNEDSELLTLLKQHMIDNESFLNPSLSLNHLAQEVSLNPRELSKIINQGTNQSFFDFVNQYRVAYAKEQMANSQDPKQTILEVMYASGFNSKSSFNTAFKKHAATTPSAWKKSNARK